MVSEIKPWQQNLALLGLVLTFVLFSFSQKELSKENSALKSEMTKIQNDLVNLRYSLDNCGAEIGEQALNNINRDKLITELKEETLSLGQVLVEVIDKTEKKAEAVEKEEMPPVEIEDGD